MNELTICTVSYGHKKLIEANIDLFKKYNSEVDVSWIIVENASQNMDRFEIGKFSNVDVLSGLERHESRIASGSYHHASGLNIAVKEAKTRFVLVLDPDFFIINKNWAADVINHMKENDLVFFGVPYNPKRYLKYRYFPCIHCLFIDTEKISKNEINFAPQYAKELHGQKNKKKTKTGFFSLLKSHARIILKRSQVIGSSRDTGYALYEKYGKSNSAKSECVAPVFKLKASKIKPTYLASMPNLLLEKILPDRLCYIPKNPGYYTQNGFKELDYPDFYGNDWDEFIWKGKPFGFHVQGAKKDGTIRSNDEVIPTLKKLTTEFEKI
ncbi:hypothetical protein A3H04_00800 [Candidatus Giovannonibacteria bacterium RIFCSPLOWO2_12_FULL_43_11c]|uniref:Glycosyltransferase 2-like domain-containing protein n=1 Tax=Candidatus Giovannonibacteria bacterium RIFCSPHIGHO2_12_FULL_43_15 TaxID=1798341 RepID=A0A1F5WNS6_9BACT|nr:MAG: hypothetical protein A3F23_01195 [Candidatus Giovannonibacteria bacterium RIFCSPHIGHO2_12_FULL_43_15]OGF91861.1 MAG: hypothetical protein A3H04_00800 [Candidatus Giovannonibacteria bacterium RIFCSPLOWO2_12_FULL_43_11c]